MSVELPVCKWRGEEVEEGRYQCSSPKLVVGPRGVPAALCRSCHCVDHAPVPALRDNGPCLHLGRRLRDEKGAVVQRVCEPCEGRRLDVFACNHPATAEDVTLADCQRCAYAPGRRGSVERVYLVNLRRRADRLAAFQARQISHGWKLPDVRVFPAVEGDTVGVPAYFREGGGAWGCLRSHISILETCLMEGVESVLVLEDDCEWFSDAWERLEVFFSRVPSDWSQLMLGGQHMQTPDQIAPGVVRCHNTQRTHAYAVRGSAIRSLLNAWYTAAVHLDWVMGGDWQRNWPVYAPEPFVFGQAGGKSDISGRLNNSLYWNAPTNALVLHLEAPPAIARVLRSYGLHTGFRRDAQGFDVGLATVAETGAVANKLASWLSTILWEVASMEGRVATVYHPGISADLVECVHGGPVRRVVANTVEEGLQAIADLRLQRSLSSTHLLWLDAPRAAVEKLVGFHRGYWLDEATGRDRGQVEAAAGDQVAGLRKWMKHAGEEAERSQLVPLLWCDGFTDAAVHAAFPDREVVRLRASRVKLIVEQWSQSVSQADDNRGLALRSDG